MTEKNKPQQQLRLGRLKATIWANETSNGTRFSVNFSRLYRVEVPDGTSDDANGWRETSSFNRDDLLTLCKLADLAYTYIHTQAGS